MRKRFLFCFLISMTVISAFGASGFIPKRFNTITSYDDVYPYRLNNAKVNPNKNTTYTNTIGTTSAAPIGKRQVVKRVTNARAAANINNTQNVAKTANQNTRRVVQRPRSSNARVASTTPNVRTTQTRGSQNVVARAATPVRTRGTARTRATSNTTSYSYTDKVTSQRCFADYKQCMEMYCQREDTAYNRCYCSAKLSQIDSKYQNNIDNLIQQIVRLKNSSDATSDDIKEYWDATVGVYTRTNPWVNIENALNIDWADTESRVRGQTAFNTGHKYCIQHLRACSYMASNMRDAYKSEIARDCDTYEQSLKKIQGAAENVIENLQSK